MGLLYGFLGCGALLVLVCGGMATFGVYKIFQLANAEPEWKAFASRQGRFTVNFPGVPKEKSTTEVEGVVLHHFVAELQGGEVAYLVMYNDLAAGAKEAGPQFLLDTIASSFGEQVKAKKNITIAGHAGMELELEKIQDGQTLLITDRIYLVENRMYQVMVAKAKGKQDPVPPAQFLDSFHLSVPAP